MSEEIFKCPCGCEGETSSIKIFEHIFEILKNHKEGLYVVGKACEYLTDMSDKKDERPDNSHVVIESLCSDIKRLTERIEKLEGTSGANGRIFYDNDVKPV